MEVTLPFIQSLLEGVIPTYALPDAVESVDAFIAFKGATLTEALDLVIWMYRHGKFD